MFWAPGEQAKRMVNSAQHAAPVCQLSGGATPTWSLHCRIPRWVQIPHQEPAKAGQPAKERRLDTFFLREEVLDIMKPLKEMLNPALFPVVSILTWCPCVFLSHFSTCVLFMCERSAFQYCQTWLTSPAAIICYSH